MVVTQTLESWFTVALSSYINHFADFFGRIIATLVPQINPDEFQKEEGKSKLMLLL